MAIISKEDGQKKFIFLIVLLLMICAILDTSLIKLYDLTAKNSMPTITQNILFTTIVVICVLLELVLYNYTRLVIRKKSKDLSKDNMNFRTDSSCLLFNDINNVSPNFSIILSRFL